MEESTEKIIADLERRINVKNLKIKSLNTLLHNLHKETNIYKSELGLFGDGEKERLKSLTVKQHMEDYEFRIKVGLFKSETPSFQNYLMSLMSKIVD